MKRSTKILLIVASALVILGATIFLTAMVTNNWDWSKLETMRLETNTYEIGESFKDISIKGKASNIIILPSEDGMCKIVCEDYEKVDYSVTVVDGMLLVEMSDERKWYDRINVISFKAPQITLYMPSGEYGSLYAGATAANVEIPDGFVFEAVDITLTVGNITFGADVTENASLKTTHGNIHIKDLSAGKIYTSATSGNITAEKIQCVGDVKIDITSGRIRLDSVNCKNFSSSGASGDIHLKNVIASENIAVVRETGDVNFDGSDAGNISVNTETGDVKGTLLSEKLFLVNTTTGKVDVPQTTNGGICKIITDTGSVKIEIAN